MVGYQPTSRRPIAQMFRRTGEGATNLCGRLGIHPDAISYFSILAAFAAALCFWKSGTNTWLLIIAPLFCYLGPWSIYVYGSCQVCLHDCDRLTIHDETCMVIIAGCVQTIIVRLKRIVTALQDGAR